MMRTTLQAIVEYLRTPVSRQFLRGQDDLKDEIQFHLESRAEEHLSQGLSPHEATEAALEQFGDVREIMQQCCQESSARQILLHRGHLLLTAGLLMATIALGFRVWSAPATEPAVLDTVADVHADQNLLCDGDVAGIVVDELGKALPNANVMVAVKWWPPNGFRQQCYMVTTNRQGEFSIVNVFPRQTEHEVQIAAMSDGHLLTSRYISDDTQALDSLSIEVPSVKTAFALEFKSANGKPVSGVAAFPHQRTDANGVGHTVYFQSADEIIRESDHAGRLQFSNFQPGDRAVVYVRFPDEDWQPREVVVPEDDSIVVIAQTASDNSGG